MNPAHYYTLFALAVMYITIVAVVWSWHRSPTTGINLQQVLVDSVTGNIAIEKVGYMTALATGTWGFVAQAVTDKPLDAYAIGYFTVFAAARVASQGIAVYKDVNKPTGTPP